MALTDTLFKASVIKTSKIVFLYSPSAEMLAEARRSGRYSSQNPHSQIIHKNGVRSGVSAPQTGIIDYIYIYLNYIFIILNNNMPNSLNAASHRDSPDGAALMQLSRETLWCDVGFQESGVVTTLSLLGLRISLFKFFRFQHFVVKPRLFAVRNGETFGRMKNHLVCHHKFLINLRLGYQNFVIDGKGIKNFRDLIKSVSDHIHLEPESFYLTKNGFSVNDSSVISELRQKKDAFYQVNIRLRGGAGDNLEENQPTNMLGSFHPSPFFLGPDKSPTAWLILIDYALENAGATTPKQKFQTLLPVLSAELLTRLANSLTSIIADENPYRALKNSIQELYREPKADIFARYFKEQTLGSDLPSEFLRKAIERLEILQTGITKDDAILRRFFLTALPAHTQAILAVSTSTSLSDLATMADKIASVTASTNPLPTYNDQVCHSITPTTSSHVVDDSPAMNLIVNALEKLNSRLDQLENRGAHKNSFNRSKSPRRGFSPKRSGILCSYHNRYRNKANRCQIGCTWSNRSSDCELLDLCVYHGTFGDKARRCVDGCRYFKSSSLNKDDGSSKNF